MKWANFLHIYQPANQVKEILDRVVNESYRPLVKILKDNPTTKITLNINAALSEQFVKNGYEDIIDDLRYVSSRGQIEFTDTAKYHAFLPFLNEEEIIRQIKLNRETNEKIFGSVYKPIGFFPPEMAYASFIGPIIEKLGYKWMIIDEIAMNGRINQTDGKSVYKIKDTNLDVYFRERIISNLIMSALVRRREDIVIDEYDLNSKDYIITGMDGETFGHHRPGLHDLLTGLLLSSDFEHVFFEELSSQVKSRTAVCPIISSWASTEKDIENGTQFLTWKDERNQIHSWQWEFQELALKTVNESKTSLEARNKLDKALASDQFFWASARPWWSLEVIELGAWLLLDTIRSVSQVDPSVIVRAEDLYHKIISKSFEWQRTGYIRGMYKDYTETPKIPFKDKTKTEPWVYLAFIDIMRNAIKKAAEKENFEEAMLWRDAIWKLETKNDIYDAMHAIDILRQKVTNEEVLTMIEKYKKEYDKLSPGQPESRG